MDSELTNYEESRLDTVREFVLCRDRLIVRGRRFLIADFVISIPLRELDPNPDRVRMRPVLCWMGSGLALFGVLGFLLLNKSFAMPWTAFGTGLFMTLAIAGGLLAVISARKVEFACFRGVGRRHGIAIARAGPEADRFSDFVERVAAQIRLIS